MTIKLLVPLVAVTLAVTFPALAQNRFMDQARENAARRAESKAIREAENPPAEPVQHEAQATPAPVPAAEPAPAQPAAAAPPAPAPAQ